MNVQIRLTMVVGLVALTTVSRIANEPRNAAPPAVHFTEYLAPVDPGQPYGITRGPDGALWFTDFGSNSNGIGRMTTSGLFTIYPVAFGAGLAGIVTGPDRALWFTEYNTHKIGRITTGSALTEYTLPSGGGAYQSPSDRTAPCGSPTTARTRWVASPPVASLPNTRSLRSAASRKGLLPARMGRCGLRSMRATATVA